MASQLKELGFTEPTPIQAQAWPVVLQGRDLIGLAETGSGKTYAFALPAVVHAAARVAMRRGGRDDDDDGSTQHPFVLVLAPTRELAMQIDLAIFPFCSALGLRHTCVYGGVPKAPQARAVKAGVDVLTATPGRVLDLVASKACRLSDVSYLAVDEADRMLSMGFEPQLREIVSEVCCIILNGAESRRCIS